MTLTEVTQADRDAAADLGEFLFEGDFPNAELTLIIGRMRAGKADKEASVQAFARHRIASTDQSRVAVLEEALGACRSILHYLFETSDDHVSRKAREGFDIAAAALNDTSHSKEHTR